MLVATKAFGIGVNIPDVRHVIQIGMPENLSLWVQELGRAGRDGSMAYVTIFVSENTDLKRLSFWTKQNSEKECAARFEDFLSAFSGHCLRAYLLEYFENKSISGPRKTPHDCYTGCFVKKEIPLKNNAKLIKSVLQCIYILNGKGRICVYEENIVDWLSGIEKQWLWKYFDKKDLKVESTFGYLAEKTKTESELILKGIIRQCLSLGLLKIDFKDLPGKLQLKVKMWSLSESGENLILGKEVDPIYLPDPLKVTELILK